MLETDLDWLIRLQQGDPAAAALLSELYTPFLQGRLRRFLSNPADIDDAVQDVFAVVLQRVRDFTRGRGRAFRDWLSEIARRRALYIIKQVKKGRWSRGVGGDAEFDPVQEPDARGADGTELWTKSEHDSFWQETLLERAQVELAKTHGPDKAARIVGVFVALARGESRPPEVAAAYGASVAGIYRWRALCVAQLNEIKRQLGDLFDP